VKNAVKSGRFVLLTFTVIAAAGVGLPATSQTRSRRPNVLLFIRDDQGYGDLGLHGNEKLRTPNLDRLGRESVAVDAIPRQSDLRPDASYIVHPANSHSFG